MNVERISQKSGYFETVFEWAQNHADLFTDCYDVYPGVSVGHGHLEVVGQGDRSAITLPDGMAWEFDHEDKRPDGSTGARYFHASKKDGIITVTFVGVVEGGDK